MALPLVADRRCPDQAGGNAFVVNDRIGAGRRFARPGPFDRAFGGDAPDLFGVDQVGGMGAAVPEIIPLHPQPLAGDGHAGQAMAAAFVTTRKPVGRGEVYAPPRKPGAGRLHLRDALDGQCGGFGTERGLFQRLGRRIVGRIAEIEAACLADGPERLGIGKAHGRVFGREARHADGAFGHLAQGLGPDVGGRDAGLTLTHHDPQPDLDALGALGLFQPSVQHVHRQRRSVHGKRVRGIRAGGLRGLQHRFGKGGEVGRSV